MGQRVKRKEKVLEGHFGEMGGRFVPETLVFPLQSLTVAWEKAKKDRAFWTELHDLLKHYVGRPTPLYFARRLSEHLGHGRFFLKREDLCHTGAHKINNALGQVLLAKRMKKTRIIAETGAGQHGVATATAAALAGIPCEVFMGEEDVKRQSANVERMKILGAVVRPVSAGSKTLKDAMNEALRDWVSNVRNTYYVIGSVAGPHPYPSMVRDLQSVVGQEVRKQLRAQIKRSAPDYLVACVGGGSNAMGLFNEFLDEKKVKIIGVEAAGRGLDSTQHAASMIQGRVGILHGSRSLYLQDEHGQISETHSIAAGLDYPGVGPQLAHLYQQGRIEVASVTDQEAIAGFEMLSRFEGIIPALETSHALAYLNYLARKISKNSVVVVNVSGRGDKDLATYQKEKRS